MGFILWVESSGGTSGGTLGVSLQWGTSGGTSGKPLGMHLGRNSGGPKTLLIKNPKNYKTKATRNASVISGGEGGGRPRLTSSPVCHDKIVAQTNQKNHKTKATRNAIVISRGQGGSPGGPKSSFLHIVVADLRFSGGAVQRQCKK